MHHTSSWRWVHSQRRTSRKNGPLWQERKHKGIRQLHEHLSAYYTYLQELAVCKEMYADQFPDQAQPLLDERYERFFSMCAPAACAFVCVCACLYVCMYLYGCSLIYVMDDTATPKALRLDFHAVHATWAYVSAPVSARSPGLATFILCLKWHLCQPSHHQSMRRLEAHTLLCVVQIVGSRTRAHFCDVCMRMKTIYKLSIQL